MNDAARFSLPEQLLRRIAAPSFSWLSKQKRRIAFSWRGQATVEGAFLIPVILLMLMLLIQPGILLYDRVVMWLRRRKDVGWYPRGLLATRPMRIRAMC